MRHCEKMTSRYKIIFNRGFVMNEIGTLLLLSCLLLSPVVFAQEKVTFPSDDGITITADQYLKNPASAPFIVLFHQAGWSRGEYREIAPKLNQLGFNCLAVDQRSGGAVNSVTNETRRASKEAGKPTGYLDAYRDVSAAIQYAKTNLTSGNVIIWGSSYSSSLVLKYAGENPDEVDGVLAFSPGEYFSNESKTYIAGYASKIKVPVFITSSGSEKSRWNSIYSAIPGNTKRSFVPKTKGNHGSRALWNKFADSKDYWEQVESFLDQFK